MSVLQLSCFRRGPARLQGCALLLGSCVLPFIGDQGARAALPPIIPREALLGNPVRDNPQISPDGRRLAYLAPSLAGVMNVRVKTLGRDDAHMATDDAHRGIGTVIWAQEGAPLLRIRHAAAVRGLLRAAGDSGGGSHGESSPGKMRRWGGGTLSFPSHRESIPETPRLPNQMTEPQEDRPMTADKNADLLTAGAIAKELGLRDTKVKAAASK